MFNFDFDLAKTVLTVMKLPFVADVNCRKGGRQLAVRLTPLLNQTFAIPQFELTIPRHSFTPEFVTQTYRATVIDRLMRQQAMAGGSRLS
ncbi:hypothetical protein [Spirosoma sp. KUDC1026]|uniref:hypothetical protein n=1 Tax=Spirosoma sp. KUDC1026 TaxID=2745947 RepID=UPI00159BE4CB|nr:hypothetical protein [Spirosoma sp. KUDC1026]QKZ14537.1 hypothetical protein HU175_18665 [Spirosoma sp. KUDC1026]